MIEILGLDYADIDLSTIDRDTMLIRDNGFIHKDEDAGYSIEFVIKNHLVSSFNVHDINNKALYLKRKTKDSDCVLIDFTSREIYFFELKQKKGSTLQKFHNSIIWVNHIFELIGTSVGMNRSVPFMAYNIKVQMAKVKSTFKLTLNDTVNMTFCYNNDIIYIDSLRNEIKRQLC